MVVVGVHHEVAPAIVLCLFAALRWARNAVPHADLVSIIRLDGSQVVLLVRRLYLAWGDVDLIDQIVFGARFLDVL